MKKQFLVIGAGRFGSNVALKLTELDQEVMIIDNDEKEVQKLSDYITFTLVGDATNEQTLQEIGVQNFDVVIVCIGENVQSSIMCSLLLNDLGAKSVVAMATNKLHEKVLFKVGVDRVVFPQQEMAIRVAHNLVTNSFFDFINLSSQHGISEIPAKEEWIGKKIVDVNFRRNFKLNIIAIRNGNDTEIGIDPNHVITSDDTFVVIGANKDIKEVIVDED